MSDAAALATARPMGRPPIGKPTPVRLPSDMLEQIDVRVGTYGRAAFIREAVAEKLERENRLDTPHGARRENGE